MSGNDHSGSTGNQGTGSAGNGSGNTTFSQGTQVQLSPLNEDKTDYRLTLLGEDNYTTWKWQILMILKSKGLDIALTGDQSTTKARQTATLLASSLSQLNMQRVINCHTAKDIWETLEANFENKSSTQKTMLLEKFTSFKIRSIKDISKDIGEIQAIAAKLKSLGSIVEDEFIISIILKALPETLKTWKSTWKMVNATSPSLNNLITSLMAEISDMRNPEGVALAAHAENGKMKNELQNGHAKNSRYIKRNRDYNNGPNRSRVSECFYCKLPGHWAKDCRKKQMHEKAGAGGTSPKYQGVAMMAMHPVKRDLRNIIQNARMKRQIASGLNLYDARRRGFAMMAIVAQRSKLGKTAWLADSGSSFHMTANLEWIRDYRTFETPKAVALGDNHTIFAKGSGNIITSFSELQDVHYVPELGENLFSIGSATEKGLEAHYDADGIKLTRNDNIVLAGTREDGVYILDFDIIQQENNALAAVSLERWHNRLGHISKDKIKDMEINHAVEGLEVSNLHDTIEQCRFCIQGKCTKASHPIKPDTKVDIPGMSLHIDTVGPFREESIGGAKYFVLCKDEASSYRLFKPVASKADIPGTVKLFVNQTLLETGNKVLRLSTDNGSEFINQDLSEFLNAHGIEHRTSVVYTPQQNGYIERDIRTIVESARSMLIKSKLPLTLWAEAVNTAIYVLNRSINSKNHLITPAELWTGRKPNIGNLHEFGQEAVVIYKDHRRSKWEAKGVIQLFVGYTERYNTFRFYDIDSNDVYISCDAKFLTDKTDLSRDSDENQEVVMIKSNNNVDNSMENNTSLEPVELSWDDEGLDITDTHLETNSHEQEETPDTTPQPMSSTPQIDKRVDAAVQTNKFITRVAKRKVSKGGPFDVHPSNILASRFRNQMSKWQAGGHAKMATVRVEEDPTSYAEAMSRSDRNNWIEAMEEEMDSLRKNDVYKLVNRPSGNVVTNKWVFKIKRTPDGQVERYKARLVARGFTQIQGIDYQETYAPVANMVTLRMLFAYAAMKSLKMAQFDVKTAFLYGELDETVYMEQPEGFSTGDDRVCLLKHSLYGLKQAPRQWNKKFTDFLKDMDLQVSEHDHCVFYRKEPFIAIAIYVDDGIILAEKQQDIENAMTRLSERFDIHVVKSSAFLGFEIFKGQKGEIGLHQTNYIKMILQKFNMDDSKSVDSPISLTKTEQDLEPLDQNTPYREAIGSLMYAAVVTRIDIAYAVNKASRSVENPTKADWIAVKRIFRYLKGREDYKLIYRKVSDTGMTVYCDSDFAGDLKTSRSTTGSIFMFGGGPIHWKSQRQSLITLSSTEAELVSLCSTVKEVAWLRKLGLELEILPTDPTLIVCDNQSAIKIATNEKSIHRTRHMSVQAGYPREQIENGHIIVEHVNSEDQLADMLTKPTTTSKFSHNVSRVMNVFTRMLCLSTILSLVPTTSHGHILERVDPIIWGENLVKVQNNVTKFRLEATFTSPCHLIFENTNNTLAVNMLTHPDPDNTMATKLNEDCQELYRSSWLRTVDELSRVRPPTDNQPLSFDEKKRTKRNTRGKGLKRSKRFIPLLWAVGAVVVGIVLLFNCIQSSMSEVVPGGDGYRIRELQNQAEIDRKRINELDAKKEEGLAKLRAEMEARYEILEEQVRNTALRVQNAVTYIPHLIWIATQVDAKIREATMRLERIIQTMKYGNLATYEISKFWDINYLADVKPEDTDLENIERKSESTIVINSYIRWDSSDTKVYRAYAFEYLVNKTGEKPYIMQYQGPSYLIYNKTSRCYKAIDDPARGYILDACATKDFRDDRLKHWVKIPLVDEHAKMRVVIKPYEQYNYIYCFGHTIYIEDEPVKCPEYPFKLRVNVAFHVNGIPHDAREYNVSRLTKWDIIDTRIPRVLLPEDYYHSADKLMPLNNELISRNLEKHIPTMMSQDSIIAIILFTLCIIAVFVYGMFSLMTRPIYNRVSNLRSQVRETDSIELE